MSNRSGRRRASKRRYNRRRALGLTNPTPAPVTPEDIQKMTPVELLRFKATLAQMPEMD